ncbi:hypothetical protein [Blattabacterium cuenoti]|uniref:hypothetical protein n=1 Tax=Blattabacterium cuenoti TaxID=1653831 RepID=UPI00163CCB2F|nr:hypothetical protein [Blattabacterium cuenoti]
MSFLIENINDIPVNTITVDRDVLEKKSKKNIYNTICILDKISSKINNKIKNDLDKKLEEFNIINKNNNLEETFENKEQIELSKFYESIPKSTSIAIYYLLNNKINL